MIARREKMSDKEDFIKEMYEERNCKITSGKGDFNSEIMMIFEGPKFNSSKRLRQISKESKIQASFYATPLKKGYPKGTSKVDVLNTIKAEIATVSPKVVWLVGNFTLNMFDIRIPMSKAYGMYFPLFLDDFFSFIVPTTSMINKMPRMIEREFYKRMNLFSTEIKSMEIPPERRIDQIFMKKFNEEHGFEYDKMLSGPKTYYMMFSNTAESHIFILPTEKTKKFFEKEVPFGVKFTQKEAAEVSPELLEHAAIIMKESGGELIDVDLDVLRRKVDV